MAARSKTNTEQAAPAPEAAAPAIVVSTEDGVTAIHAAIFAETKASAAQAEADKSAKTVVDRTRFEHTIDSMVRIGERICQGYAPILGYDPMTVSGSTIHKQVKDPESLIHNPDAEQRSKSGSESHWDRCATMWQRDTEELRAKFIAAKTMATNKEIYALWLAVILGFKTLEDCSPESSVTVDPETGKVTAAVVKGPRRTEQQIKDAADKAAKAARKVLGLSETASTEQAAAVTLPGIIGTLAAATPEQIDAYCNQYAARLSSINPEMWESMALAFGAGVIQRERLAAEQAPADSEAAALAALAATV